MINMIFQQLLGLVRHTPSDIKDVKKHIQDLNEKGCEGLVFKPTDPSEKTVKYVTAGSCLRDMMITSPLMIEYQAEFFTNRMLRSLFYLLEHDLHLNEEFLKKQEKPYCCRFLKV